VRSRRTPPDLGRRIRFGTLRTGGRTNSSVMSWPTGNVLRMSTTWSCLLKQYKAP
jgi:hypothetical protein